MRKQVEWRGKMYQMPSAVEWDIRPGFEGSSWMNYAVEPRGFLFDGEERFSWGNWGKDNTAALSVDMDSTDMELFGIVFGEVLPDYVGAWFDMYDINVYPIEALDVLIARLREILDALATMDWDKIPSRLYQDEEEGKVRREPVMAQEYGSRFKYDALPAGTQTLDDLLTDDAFRREWKAATEKERREFNAATSGIAESLYRTLLDEFETIRKAHPEAWYFVIYGV